MGTIRQRLRLAVIGALAWACGQPLAQPAAATVLPIVAGALPAAERLISAQQGDVLRWRITSDLPGEVHLHAYRLSVSVQPGQVAELAFKAHASGRFRVEWHPALPALAAHPAESARSPDSLPVALHPAPHHAAPLATLEVHPR